MDMNVVVDNSGLMLLMVQLATMPNSGLDISVEIVTAQNLATASVNTIRYFWRLFTVISPVNTRYWGL
jgi:hypothetical protein